VRFRTERANKTRALSIGCPIHNHAQPALHSLYSTGSRGTTTFTAGLPARAGLTAASPPVFLLLASQAAPCVLLRVLLRVRVARIFPLSPADPASASQELRLPSCLPWRSRSGLRPVHFVTHSLPERNLGFRSFSAFRIHNLQGAAGEKSRLLPALHDHAIGALVAARLLAERRESPRRLGVIALNLPFTTAVRVIHGVHGNAANRGTNTLPARAAGLAVGLVFVIHIADLATVARQSIETCELRRKAS